MYVFEVWCLGTMVPQMYHIGKDEYIQKSNHIYIKYFRPQIFESKLKLTMNIRDTNMIIIDKNMH
jgi:hypothetical protein